MPGTVYSVARAVMATVVADMVACGLERPLVYVARQGAAADDFCPCSGVLVAIVMETRLAATDDRVPPTPGIAPYPQLRTAIRFRLTRCWSAVPSGVPVQLPAPETIDTASRGQLADHASFSRALTLGQWAAEVPDAAGCQDWRLTPIVPVVGGGCAGWQSTLSFSHDPGA